MSRYAFKKGFVLILLILISVSGCVSGKTDTGNTNFDDQNTYLNMSSWTESDVGIYYIQRKNGYDLLKYVDKKSAKETVLCQKLNCRHDSKDCPAAGDDDEIMNSMAYSKGKLYYMVYETVEESLDLYCMEQNGTGKELLHKFKNQWSPPNGAGLYRGRIFLSIPTMEQFEDGTGAISAEPSLIMYDLNSGKETVILDGREEKESFAVPCGGSGDSIYFWELGFDKDRGCVFGKYDFTEDLITTVLEADEKDIQLVRDDRFYVQPKGMKKLRVYLGDTGELRDVLELPDGISTVYVKDRYLELRKENEQSVQAPILCNWYDLPTGNYLFEEFQDSEELEVIGRLENAYWIRKEDGLYLVALDSRSWKKIETVE